MLGGHATSICVQNGIAVSMGYVIVSREKVSSVTVWEFRHQIFDAMWTTVSGAHVFVSPFFLQIR